MSWFISGGAFCVHNEPSTDLCLYKNMYLEKYC